MKLTLYTERYFNAAHQLSDYKGKCAQLHGHTWKISVWVQGEETQKQPNGILWDFGNIKQVIALLDHTNLNTVIKDNPTAENITRFIYTFFKNADPHLEFLIRVYENPIQPLSFCQMGDFSHV